METYKLLRTIFALLGCHLLVVIFTPSIWQGIATGYPGDSFWTLSLIGRCGVILISLSGMALISVLNASKTQALLRHSRNRWPVLVWLLDCILGVLLFVGIYAISPQVFYGLYQLLIPGLPNQWVIDDAARWREITTVFIPRFGGSMADHLVAIALGGIILFTSYLHRRQKLLAACHFSGRQ